MLPITVVIPVKNEEIHLPACLESLGDEFAEIVVVDSRSTDRTRAIAEAAGALVLDFNWNGGFPKKRNWVLAQHAFRTPWVLFLDANERLTPAFIRELHATLPDTRHSGFRIPLRPWLNGRRLRFAGMCLKPALFRVGAVRYDWIAGDCWSTLDVELLEKPIVEGTLGDMSSPLERRDLRGMDDQWSKLKEHANWEANRYFWLRSSGPDVWAALDPHERVKYRWLDQWWLGWYLWFRGYVFSGGFLDGWAGFRFHQMKRRYLREIRVRIQNSGK